MPAAVNLLLCSLLSGSQNLFWQAIKSCATENWRGVFGKGIKPSSVCSLGFCRRTPQDRASPLSSDCKLFVSIQILHLPQIPTLSLCISTHSIGCRKCKFLRQPHGKRRSDWRKDIKTQLDQITNRNGIWTYPTVLIEVNNIFTIFRWHGNIPCWTLLAWLLSTKNSSGSNGTVMVSDGNTMVFWNHGTEWLL